MNTKLVSVLLLTLTCLAGCKSYIPLTKPLRDEFADDLTKLQFYISHGVELSRELRSEERGVDGHVIRIEKGKRIEIVQLQRNTPGVLAKIGEEGKDEFFMKFEPEGPQGDRHLVFQLEAVEGLGDLYRLQLNGGDSTVAYDGKEYIASRLPHLLIDLQQIEEIEKEKRVLPGVKLQ